MSSHSQYHILIVEDDAEIREILVDLLHRLDFVIVEASNGREGFERLRVDPKIVAIVSDIQMPVMNGLEMVETIRAAKYETPVVFLSGYVDKDKAIQAMKLNAMEVLEKPYDAETLLNSVKRAALLGQSLRTLDFEINELCKNYNVPESKRELFMRQQREIIKVRKLSEVMDRTKAA